MIQSLDLAGVVEDRRRRERRELLVVLQRPVERRQGVVVLPIGGLPFAVEPLEKIGEGAFALHRRLRRRPSGHPRFASARRRG